MKLIVGLVGFKGSGKDTAANIFVSRGFTKDSFAAPIKDAVAQIFSWDRELIEGATEESRAWREIPDSYWSAAFGCDVMPRVVLGAMSCLVWCCRNLEQNRCGMYFMTIFG